MTQELPPQGQSIERLSLIASFIDELVAGATEHYATLQVARARSNALDEYIVQRVIQVFTALQSDLWLFEEQLRRWQAKALGVEQRREVARLGRQLQRLRVVLPAILALAQELKAEGAHG